MVHGRLDRAVAARVRIDPDRSISSKILAISFRLDKNGVMRPKRTIAAVRVILLLTIALTSIMSLEGFSPSASAKPKVRVTKKRRPTTTTIAATTTVASTVAPTTTTTLATTTAAPVTTTTFPTRPSKFEGTGFLTATIVENPFKCTGPGARTYVTYTGLAPGETLKWVWGLAGGPTTASGTSSAGGTTGFSIWACNPSQAGQVWTFTLTGSSGNSITYDLVLS